jgi:hypothetical protein
MAINFPDSPNDGDQYTYPTTNGITYVFIDPDGAGGNDGYWAVLTASSASVATGAEINAGTDDVKYITPKAVADSGLARKDIPETFDDTVNVNDLLTVTGNNTQVARLVNPTSACYQHFANGAGFEWKAGQDTFNNFLIYNQTDGWRSIYCFDEGGVELNYLGSQRLLTNSGGVYITGNAYATAAAPTDVGHLTRKDYVDTEISGLFTLVGDTLTINI